MHVDIVSAFDDLHDLRQNWDYIYNADPEGHYFLSWHWIARWFETRSLWFVLAAKQQPQDKTYVAFLPIQLDVKFEERQGLVNVVRLGGASFAGLNGFLSRPEDAQSASIAFAECLQRFRWKYLELDDIYISQDRRESFLSAFSPSVFSQQKVARPAHVTSEGENIDHDVYVYVALEDTFETFLNERLGSHTRRNARKALRDLEAPENELRITQASVETMDRDLGLFYDMWDKQWGEAQPKYGKFILDNSRQMLPACIEDGCVFMPILWHQDKPVATFINFLDPARKTVMCFLAGRDLTFRRSISPGFMLHCYNMRWAIENGFRTYDLGTGNYGYKDLLGSSTHVVERLLISTVSGQNIDGCLDPRSLGIANQKVRQLFEYKKAAAADFCCRQILAVDAANQQAQILLRQIEAKRRASIDALGSRFNAAGKAHRTGNLTDAERGYLDVISLVPDHFDALHNLSMLLLQKGDPKGAETTIDRAIGVKPSSASAHCNRGNILTQLARFDDALISYDHAIRLNTDHAVAFNNRANVLCRLGRYSEALESYDHAIAIDPGYAQAHKNRDMALKRMAVVSV